MKTNSENKDTPEWKAYYEAERNHIKNMQEKKPNVDDPEYWKKIKEWDMEYAMNYPNPPGYYRANND